MNIWANTIVKNEERYLWYAVMSIIDHVDKILIWDSGSTDKTLDIIAELQKQYPDKVIFKQIPEVSITSFTEARQKMLEITKKEADWLIMLDGDEVWWEQNIKEVTDLIRSQGSELESVVTHFRNIIRDIYHYQPETAGMYTIDNVKGHLTIRAFNLHIPGIHHAKPHGQQGIYDSEDVLLQYRDLSKRRNCGIGFLHFTNVVRSSTQSMDKTVIKRGFKYKYELGESFPLDYYYPEAFFKPRPKIIPSPWHVAPQEYLVKAYLQTPLKKIKRKILPAKHGY